MSQHLTDDAVQWRVEVMRAQLVPGRGSIPFLVARHGCKPKPDDCVSCGDALGFAPVIGMGPVQALSRGRDDRGRRGYARRIDPSY